MQWELSMRKILLGNNGVIVSDSKAHYIEDGTVPQGYRKLTGIIFDGEVLYSTRFRLEGSDTLKFSFMATKACNVLGCYSTTSAQNNFSLYIGTATTSKYTRYNGGTYNSYIKASERYDVVFTPTGIRGLEVDSNWTEKSFVADNAMLIGSTSLGATSAKLTGIMYENIEIVDKALFVPVERISDGEIGYYDVVNDTFSANIGSGTPVILGYA